MTFSNFNIKIRSLQFANHLAALAGIICLCLGYISIDYLWIGIAFYIWFVLIGSAVGLHRYFSHRSFVTNKFWHYALGITGTLCTVGSIIGWAGLHRYHHVTSDTEMDPHDPRRIGLWNAWTYRWNPSRFTKKYIRMELQDPMIVFLHKNYFKVIIAYVVLLAVINPWLVVWCYCIPACGSYLGISAVTVIGHLHGYKTHQIKDDQARNSWIASILSLGEGWHNNHHAHPYDRRQGHLPWELDPAAWIIENIIATD
jgi:stearoyl-CoA desaturase (delta-9 desaturase)